MSIDNPQSVTLVAASDANYFFLLRQLVESIKDDPIASTLSLSILDLGLDKEQIDWLKEQGATLAVPEWDFDFPARDIVPAFFRAILARPFLPKYFPGYEAYISIDADTWVQDGTVLKYYARAAREGKLAITPESDRAYFTTYRRPKLFGWGQNFKAYKYNYGFKVADRLARNPLCNAGIFAMPGKCEHWDLYRKAIDRGLQRHKSVDLKDMYFWLVEQTALNYVVFGDEAPSTLLPAYCNWFCAKAEQVFDEETGLIVEPHEPHQPLGILHLAGGKMHERIFTLKTRKGGEVQTRLTYDAVRELRKEKGLV